MPDHAESFLLPMRTSHAHAVEAKTWRPNRIARRAKRASAAAFKARLRRQVLFQDRDQKRAAMTQGRSGRYPVRQQRHDLIGESVVSHGAGRRNPHRGDPHDMMRSSAAIGSPLACGIILCPNARSESLSSAVLRGRDHNGARLLWALMEGLRLVVAASNPKTCCGVHWGKRIVWRHR
jgi:hypothetical protein